MTQGIATAPGQPLWTPKAPLATSTHLFKDFVNAKRGLRLETYQDLYAWSVTDIDSFWADCWEYTGTKFSTDYTQVLEGGRTMDEVPQ
ncbi:hypothetical protein H4R23_006783, partial [Coemansia sp. Cherry 401B]